MAKRTQTLESDSQIEEGVALEEKTTPPRKITFDKYVHLSRPELTKYRVSYLSVKYRGIMKTTDGWDIEIRKIKQEGET